MLLLATFPGMCGDHERTVADAVKCDRKIAIHNTYSYEVKILFN